MDLPMPKPWVDRQAAEAELLEAAPAKSDDAPIPALKPAFAALASRIADLGERQAHCEEHGAYASHGRRIGLREHWTGCPSCAARQAEEQERARREAEAEARRAALREVLQRTELPPAFVGRTFETYVVNCPEQQAALDACRRFVERFPIHMRHGSTLVMSGGVGTGKGHLAGAILQALLPAHVGLYVTSSGLIRMVRDTWGKGAARREAEVIEQLAAVDLLVIDEVGVQYGSDAEKTLMFEVLDRRYMDRKPSVLITNLDRGRFQEFVGDRLWDRLHETGKWLSFTWGSYRSKARNSEVW